MLTNPRYQITEFGTIQLIGPNDQVDQNDYGTSQGITLGDGIRPVSGEILTFMFYTSEADEGAIQEPEGYLFLMDANPSVAAGDTSITSPENKTILGVVPVATTDWTSDANGARACIVNCPIAFHNLTQLFAVWFHTDATSFNDLAADEEFLHFNAWYRRDT